MVLVKRLWLFMLKFKYMCVIFKAMACIMYICCSYVYAVLLCNKTQLLVRLLFPFNQVGGMAVNAIKTGIDFFNLQSLYQNLQVLGSSLAKFYYGGFVERCKNLTQVKCYWNCSIKLSLFFITDSPHSFRIYFLDFLVFRITCAK